MKLIKMILAFICGALAMYLCVSFVAANFSWAYSDMSGLNPKYQFIYVVGRVLIIFGGCFAVAGASIYAQPNKPSEE